MTIKMLFVFILVLFGTGISFGTNIELPKINPASQALVYLSKFGYLDPSVMNTQAEDNKSGGKIIDVRQSIMEFQAFAGLEQTGLLDEQTVVKMNTPRCGVRDKVGYGSNARKKRYALQGSRWKVKHLNFRVTKYPKGLTMTQTNFDIERAFKVWSDVTDLTFSKWVSGKVHIEIRFESGEHGDGDPFDGKGGTLAHAYFPIYGGDAHFDNKEIWTVDSYRGTNLLQVAAHEFGHSLGLSHSDVQSALMAPFYRGYEPKIVLDRDDIMGIQGLYGKKTYEAAPKPQATTTEDPTINYIPHNPPTSELCKDSSFDAITTLGDKNTYVFKGDQFWKLNDDGIAPGYPKRIRTHFIGLPTKIDAAFTWTNGKTYFFKGDKYYRFTNFEIDSDYPKSMSTGFAGIPNNIDAVFVWSGNGKIYFFKGTNYYKFDPAKKPPVAAKYPKDIDIWEGLPYFHDDALQFTNGFTYFFRNGKYWRFNDRGFKVDAADPPFPRPVGPWWFGCPETAAQTMERNATNTNTGDSQDAGTADYSSGFVDTDPSAVSDPYDTYSNYYDDDYADNWSSIPQGSPKAIGYKKKSKGSGAAHPTNNLSYIIIPVLLRIAFG